MYKHIIKIQEQVRVRAQAAITYSFQLKDLSWQQLWQKKNSPQNV
jgi:hypothetical protein